MTNPRSRGFSTFYALLAGLVIAVVGALYFSDNIRILIHDNFWQRSPGPDHDPYALLSLLFKLLLLSGVGFLLLHASDWIHKDVDINHGLVNVFFLLWVVIVILCFVPIVLHAWSVEWLQNHPSRREAFFPVIAKTLTALPGILGVIVILPLLLAPFIGGVLCLPRIIIYYTTHHLLLAVWQKNKGETGITSSDIAKAVGNPSQNPTQALKLKHDLQRLEEEIQKHQEELATEREQLQSAILGDVERFETEKRISTVLMGLERLNTEVDVYRKYVQEKESKRGGSSKD